MQLLAGIKRSYRAHANWYPDLFNWQQRVSDKVRARLGYVHDNDFRGLRLLNLTSKSVFLDIGANYGQSIDSICTIYDRPSIIAFEPNVTTFEYLQKQYCTSKNVILNNCALGNNENELILNIPSCGGVLFHQNASIQSYEPNEIVRQLRRDGFPFVSSTNLQITSVPVAVRTLDSFNIYPDFVKIDVEGNELKVLQGACETIGKAAPVFMIERGHHPDIVSFLSNAGYVRYVFDGICMIEAGDRTPQNSFFIKKGQSGVIL